MNTTKKILLVIACATVGAFYAVTVAALLARWVVFLMQGAK